jgi:putative DeoR family transcriptional regulator (stage III sporulation protein D)
LREDLRADIEGRVVAVSEYIVKENATVRQAAAYFGISKSTVHKDVTDRLKFIKPSLAAKVREVLDFNKSERHIRGGLATRKKYEKRTI